VGHEACERCPSSSRSRRSRSWSPIVSSSLALSLSGRGLAMLVGKQNSKVVASGLFGGTDFDSRVLL
jgi:hypothetical protein